jgi:hypothetical protein
VLAAGVEILQTNLLAAGVRVDIEHQQDLQSELHSQSQSAGAARL